MGIQIDADGAGMSGEHQNVPAVVEGSAPVRSPAVRGALAVPAVIAGAGDHAARRFLEFFRRHDPQQEYAHGLLPGRLPREGPATGARPSATALLHRCCYSAA